MGAFTSIKTLMADPSQMPHIAEMIENDFRLNGFVVTQQTGVAGDFTLVMKRDGFFRQVFALDQRLYVKMSASGDKVYFEARSNIFVKSVVYQVILTIAELLLAFLVILFPLFLAMEVTFVVGLVKQAKLDNRALAIAEKFENYSFQTAPTTARPTPNVAQTVFCPSCGNEVSANSKFCTSCGSLL